MSPEPLFEEVSRRFYEAAFIRDLGIRLVSASEGKAVTRLEVGDDHLQQDGYVHAGVVAALADHTGGAAGWSLVKPHQTVLTVEFKINFLNPARAPQLVCKAKVLRPGGRIIAAEAEVTNPDGQLAAKLTMTLAVVETAKLKK